ncbi:alkyl/aryl-sulfatase [Ferrimonas marina]|uniref:Alkyl sulfatase BDS1, metallo-beta-lactamase superfamily n=1 Tax=Ferrimonas marina TaxID=299255 RepID=A0A1M5XVK5_9GAMM|nr:alkyl sulfatase dimerization domain-containing protein [Ferrimonas marina]SHI03558.1 Alkyl sulfatase BDS1, metallo-beta-lactamase superfamily [Ferrimonas marina]
MKLGWAMVGWLLGMGATALASEAPAVGQPNAESQHFDSKGKLPSEHTRTLLQQQIAELPFDDELDFSESQRGFIAAPPFQQIIAEAGHVAWDMGQYQWLLSAPNFDSIHPSLRRQAVLNLAYGLYEVVPDRIYQVRGFDLANITFVRGDTGWIIFDPLTCRETASAALAFVNQQLGARPVVAVIYSHSHADHFGGVRGVVEEAKVSAGEVPILAPQGFMAHAVAENIYAGNAMNRRLVYQYGLNLPRSPYGQVDQGIGKTVAQGQIGLLAPTREIRDEMETLTLDGVEMVFHNTPGTEAPAEMNTYFPQWKALWAAENISATVHNIYTLRGALVRDALEWSKQINQALYHFGQEAEVMFSAHNWPRWGNARIQSVMRAQRDSYANLHNGVLHLANQGVTVNEIHNLYRPPLNLRQQWAAHSYHGSEAINARAVINRYLGFWDGNPSTLMPPLPRESATLLVEMMGGADRIIPRAQQLVEQGQYRLAITLLNELVYAESGNQVAKDLLADAFEQFGYQQESTGVRNSFLAAARELRYGIQAMPSVSSLGPDMVGAISTSRWLDYLAIRLDSSKVEGVEFTINLVTPDNGERFVLELSNDTLSHIAGFQAERADLTLTLTRQALEQVMTGQSSLDALISAGEAKLEGAVEPLSRLMTLMVSFTPDFEMMPGTSPGPTGEAVSQPLQPLAPDY